MKKQAEDAEMEYPNFSTFAVMQHVSQLTEFGKVFLFLIIGIIMVMATFFISKLLAPAKPNPEKLLSYECGEDPQGNSWVQFNPRFYVIALIFLLFDVEMVFIFPWATVFGQEVLIVSDSRWGWFALAEMFVFIGILLLGLVYVWKKGDLEWIRSKARVPKVATGIPASVYTKINNEQYAVKPFSTATASAFSSEEEKAETKPLSGIRPAFKPAFRKPIEK